MPIQLDTIQLDTMRLDNIADELAKIWHQQGNDRELQFDEDVIYEKFLGQNSGSWTTEATSWSNKENDSWFSSNGSSPTKATSNTENDSWFSSNGSSPCQRPGDQHEEPTQEWQFDEDVTPFDEEVIPFDENVIPPAPDFTVRQRSEITIRQRSEKSLGQNSGNGSTEATSNKENDSWFGSNGSSRTKATSNRENGSWYRSNGSSPRQRSCHQHEESNRAWQFEDDVDAHVLDSTVKQRRAQSLGEKSESGSTESDSCCSSDGSSNKENNSWFCSPGSSPTKATSNKENGSWFSSKNGSSPRQVVDGPGKFDINHDQDLIIHLDEGSTLNSILLRLASNLNVRNLEIARAKEQEAFLRSPEELVRFFSAVQKLRRLESVAYKNFSEDSMDIMADWMYFHPTLKHIQVHFVNGAVDSAFLEALNSIMNLEEVELDMRESFSMSDILRSNVRILRLLSDDFEFDDSHILQLARELETNTSLVSLDSEPRLSASSLRALSDAFRKNRTLEKFSFSFTNKNLNKKSSEGRYVLLEMMHALQGNTTLRVLWNHSYDRVHVTEELMDQVLASLQNNDTLEKFRFFDEDFEFYEAANLLLKRNKDRKRSQVRGKRISARMGIDDEYSIGLCSGVLGELVDSLFKIDE